MKRKLYLLTGFFIGLSLGNYPNAVYSVETKSLASWQQEAEQGNIKALYHMGNVYFKGDGVAQDYHQAFLWYEKAANNGDEESRFNLNKLYYHGIGVTKDLEKAKSYAMQSCENKHMKACRFYDLMAQGSKGIIHSLRPKNISSND